MLDLGGQPGMNTATPLNTKDMLSGLERYRAIAKHDLLSADITQNPDAHRRHAEVRRRVYAELAATLAKRGMQEALQQALARYEQLPHVHGTPTYAYVAIKAEETALENFFIMVGLDNKTRREARARRQKLGANTQLHA
jgi:hypothetical protein